MNKAIRIGFLVTALVCSPARAEELASVSGAKTDDNGISVHEARSVYQAAKTQIRVLQPDKVDKSKKHRVVYVLPVEAESGDKYGDGLKEMKKLDLHNKLGVVFVAPTFSQLPWYADHPTKPEVRQEAYFVQVVVPFIDKTYPVLAEAKGRLLLGFSKSGWGRGPCCCATRSCFTKRLLGTLR